MCIMGVLSFYSGFSQEKMRKKFLCRTRVVIRQCTTILDFSALFAVLQMFFFYFYSSKIIIREYLSIFTVLFEINSYLFFFLYHSLKSLNHGSFEHAR